MKESVAQFIYLQWDTLLVRAAEHLAMAGMATLAALVVGVLFCVFTFRTASLRVPLLTIVGLLQTIPGIALLVIMMSLFNRIGVLPATATLFLFALLPIVQNTMLAFSSLPPALNEASRAMGMTQFQRLRFVRLPLALPGIVAGLRIAAVQTIGLATLAAFIGAGGLGQFINRGLFLSDTRLILLGAIPAALMALVIDQFISLVEIAVTTQRSLRTRRIATYLSVLIALVLLSFTLLQTRTVAGAQQTIVVGSKNFTEQLIIAEIVSGQIERNTSLKVERRFGLGGSAVLHQALTQGSVGIAVEYSGTALTAILHLPAPEKREDVMKQVKEKYEKQFGLVWLEPLGFNNSYGLGVRGDDIALKNVRTISDLVTVAPQLQAAFDFEFAERPDGYAGLQKAYGLHFKEVRDMHPDLMYKALAAYKTDVISAYTTDGRLAQNGIRILQDDKGFFPPYEASIVVSQKTLNAYPELRSVLQSLSDTLNDDKMRELNGAVDSGKMTVEQAAAAALSGMKGEN